MCREKSFLFLIQIMVVVLLLHHHHQTCDAITNTSNQTYCPPSSCGKISNIKHPFRLKDDPTSCGDPRYELSCENNITTLTLYSGKYYVKSINYNNYTIRIVDPGIEEGDCSSFPHYYLYNFNFTSSYNYIYDAVDPYQTYQSRIVDTTRYEYAEALTLEVLKYPKSLQMFQHVIYMNCSSPVRDDPVYADAASCMNKSNSQGGHVYAIAGDLKVRNYNHDDCHVEIVTPISFFRYNYSSEEWNTPDGKFSYESHAIYGYEWKVPNQMFDYSEIHRMLVGGFEVSWMSGACEDHCGKPECYLRETTWSLECNDPSSPCRTTLGFYVGCGTGPPSKLRMFVEGMAPKTTSKRQRNVESSSSRPRVNIPQHDAARFLSWRNQERYEELRTRRIWSEKRFEISEEGEYGHIAAVIKERKWGILCTPPRRINYEIVLEFYANAIPSDPSDEFTFTTYVRGRTVTFDRMSINSYLGKPLELVDDEEENPLAPTALCDFGERQRSGDWDHDSIAQDIFQAGKSYDVSRASGKPFRAFREHMTTEAQVILTLILYNIRPKSHTSSTTLDVTPLVHYILTQRQVDVARLIANEMRIVAESGLLPPAKPKCPLTFPGLIMGLCRRARVHMPSQVDEEIKNPIDDRYINRYCSAPAPVAPPSPPHTSPRPSSSAGPSHMPPPPPETTSHPSHPTIPPLDFSGWDYATVSSMLLAQNASNHRALTTLQSHLHDSGQSPWTPVFFSEHIAWPGDRPFFPGGAEAAGAGDDQDAGDDGDDDADVDADLGDDSSYATNSIDRMAADLTDSEDDMATDSD